jgi:hypothetical protein
MFVSSNTKRAKIALHIQILFADSSRLLALAERGNQVLFREREGAANLMPMSQEEQVRLLSMVDILGPLSEEEMQELAERVPDT